MSKDLNFLKFNMTDEMYKELVYYSSLKSKLEKYKKENNKDSIEKLENEMRQVRRKFISNFKKNNKNQIEEYLFLINDK